ncbi:hypothetical protein GCM10027516_16840 [Niabella aquatica]
MADKQAGVSGVYPTNKKKAYHVFYCTSAPGMLTQMCHFTFIMPFLFLLYSRSYGLGGNGG